MKKYFLLLTILFIFFSAQAEIRVNSYVENRRVGLSDILKLTIEISDETNKNIRQPDLPDIPNFKLIGTSSSHSSSMQIVNGRMTSSTTISYLYQLRPLAVGKFIIPPIRATIKGKDFVTEPISVEVIQGTTAPLPQTSSGNQNQAQASSDSLEDNLFIVAEVSKRNVFRGEPLEVTYKMYTRYTIANLSFLQEPEFSGFWKETTYRAEYNQFQRERYQGQMFNMMPLISVALFPTTTGKITIPAIEMSVDVRIEPRSFFDFGSTKRFTVSSKPITINVKDVPLQDRPEHFSGAIGNFDLKSSISSTSLKVGDSFTYTMEISGNGNIAQFEQPVLPSINHLRFLDPEITTSVADNKISGVKTVKYLVIAQEKGKFTIPAIPFSYFDTKQEKYVTLYTKSFQIDVAEGSGLYIPASTSQAAVQAEALDIRFIITDIDLEKNKLYFSTILYWLLWILILLTILPVSWFAKEQEKLTGNLDYTRQKQANKILKKYLKEASYNASTGKMEFYASAQNGLSNYLADKCRIPRGSTTEMISAKLKEMKLNQETTEQIQSFFEICNQSRFMPGGFSVERIKDDFKTLKLLLNDISKWKMEK